MVSVAAADVAVVVFVSIVVAFDRTEKAHIVFDPIQVQRVYTVRSIECVRTAHSPCVACSANAQRSSE